MSGRTSLDLHDAKDFYKFNGSGCPRAVENPKNFQQQGMNKFSDKMFPVSFDEWAYAVANREKFMPAGSIDNDVAKENFNKIWDGKKFRYVVNKDRKLCSVVRRSDILESFTNKPGRPKTMGQQMDNLEDSLTVLLRNLGATIDKTVEAERLKRDKIKRERFQETDKDRDLRNIRDIENPNHLIKPSASHGCDPLTPIYSDGDSRTDGDRLSLRSNFATPQSPQNLTIRTRVSKQERLGDGYVGRVPARTGDRHQPFTCLTPGDPTLNQSQYRSMYHGLQELEDNVPHTVSARGVSHLKTKDDEKEQAATSGELYALSTICAQQITEEECGSTNKLKVHPMGYGGDKTPSDMCSFVQHPHKGHHVCVPKQIETTTDPDAKAWYYGNKNDDGGFVDYERLLLEKYRQKHDKDYRHADVISDAELESRDLEREMEAMLKNSGAGIRRFSRPHQKPNDINGSY